jgi:hypothetical protein
MKSIVLSLIIGALAVTVSACADFPGADGRYATRDRGTLNRGGAEEGLPATPYVP